MRSFMKASILTLLVVLSATLSAQAVEMNSKTFLKCFEKAFDERIAEVKELFPNANICNGLSKEDKIALQNAYQYRTEDGHSYYYSAKAMSESTIRLNYDILVQNITCYKETSFIGALLFKRLYQIGQEAAGKTVHNDFELIETAMDKMLGQSMWADNGYDLLGDHHFTYCEE